MRTALRRGSLSVAALIVGSCTNATDSGIQGDVASVAVTPSSTSVAVGAQVPLQATAQDADGKVVTGATVVWTVKDKDIASVSAAGVVTGLAVGTTQVAANINGKSGIAAITVQKTPVASVIVRPNHIDASPGAKTQLTAVAYDAAQNPLADRAIIWASSNNGVASVDANGMVTATGPGNASITATAEGKSDAATVTVTQAPVASVTVTPSPLSMSVGQTTTLTAVTKDASGAVVTGRAVSWTSSNTSVATISSSGVVTAVSAGTTTITATSEGKSGTGALTVSNFAVASVNVQPGNSTILQGASVQLSATIQDVNGSTVNDRPVTWTSSNTAIATVNATGLVTGVAPGTATITATSESKSGSASVVVQAVPVGSVVVSPSAASVTTGQSTPLTVVVKDQNGTPLVGRVVSWTTSNSAVATVSSSGMVSGVAPGSATIMASSGGQSGTATITVTPIPVASVTVAPATLTIQATTTGTLSATVKDANGTTVTDRTVAWTSSNTSVATVSSSGVVTGVAPGSATITATSETKSGTATVTVTPAPVGSVTVTPSTANVVQGTTTTLAAVVKDPLGGVLTGRTVTWSSSNTSVATVSSSGVVTGVALGAATITATSEGKSGTADITVIPPPVATVTVSPATASIQVGAAQNLTATTKDANGSVLTGRTIAWSSSATSVATVSSTGVVTGVGAGIATITATSEGKSGSSTITVTLVPVGSVTVAPANASVFTTQTTQLTATVKDANGTVVTDRTVAWTSSNSLVATVSQTGLVTGILPGSVTITATSETKSGSATVAVSLIPVNSVTVSPSSATVIDGQTAQLSATTKDFLGNTLTGRTVTWSSSNTSVATVSSSGLVTGVDPGNATITAASEGKTGTSSITVTPVPIASVTVSPSSVTVLIGANTTLTATPKDSAGNVLTGRTIAWSSSNTAVATVSSSGVVTGVAVGTVTITASSGGQTGSATVTVSSAPVASVTVTPSSVSIGKGETVTLTATVKDANGNVLTGRVVTWTTSDPNKATVSSNGQTAVVTGVQQGNAIITATSEGKSGISGVTVTK